MKTFQKLSFLVALAGLISFSSCSDDEKDPVKSDAELIGSGVAWKFSTVTNPLVGDVSAFIDACHLDNLITFNYETTIKIGVVDSGATKCDDSNPQTEEFTWDYNELTKVLSVDSDVIDIPGAEGDFKVNSVTPMELVLSQSVELEGLGTQEVILTLVH